jgi:anti-sigma regulatory factor (Ser/Thr protein kinase)
VATASDQRAVTLPADADAPRRARRFLRDALRDVIPVEPLQTVLLLGTELVTNAVRHATPPIELTLQLARDEIRVEVCDGSTRLPQRPESDPASSSGRGLQLLEVLAIAWGVTLRGPGKAVWFRVSRDGRRLNGQPSAAF